ncbi:MAG TPA: NAD(P)H:quinone oxidoreductase [Gammaproteobacteria bacterium]|nr:NAD(P)H:quinone oxidoreductase [Gammaproteobacteria bacterium]
MAHVLVLYYSMYGHIERMAEEAAAGAREVPGTEVTIKRVPELIPREVAEKAGVKLDQPAPIAEPGELGDYDGIMFGTPTRYGNMCGQMRNFLDQTGPLWQSGILTGRPAAVFTSTNTQHGGQETTLTSFHSTLFHLGFVVVGCPYTCPGISESSEISGGSPYGASTIAGSDGSRQPSKNELDVMRFQARHMAQITYKLSRD